MSGETMQGRRLPEGYHDFTREWATANGRDEQPCEAGDYWKQNHRSSNDAQDYAPEQEHRSWDWYVCDPQSRVGRLGDHSVVEHEDGTITVSPSILNAGGGTWHGFLEHGVWRSC